jgi:hypothetical protein
VLGFLFGVATVITLIASTFRTPLQMRSPAGPSAIRACARHPRNATSDGGGGDPPAAARRPVVIVAAS